MRQTKDRDAVLGMMMAAVFGFTLYILMAWIISG